MDGQKGQNLVLPKIAKAYSQYWNIVKLMGIYIQSVMKYFVEFNCGKCYLTEYLASIVCLEVAYLGICIEISSRV